MTNKDFKYGMYDKNAVTPGYFGDTAPTSVDDKLKALGLSDEVEEKPKSTLVKDMESKGFLAKVGEGLTNFGEGVNTFMGDAVKDIGSGFYDLGGDIHKLQEGRLDETTGLLGKFFQAGEGRREKIDALNKAIDETGGGMFDKAIGTGLNVFGAGVDFTGDALVSGLKTLAPEGLERATKNTIQNFAQTPIGQGIIGFIKEGGEKYNQFKASSPEANALGLKIEALLPFAEAVTGGVGAKIGKEVGGTIIKEGVDLGKKGYELGKQGVDLAKEGYEIGKEGVKAGVGYIKDQTPSKVLGDLPKDIAKKIAGIDDQSAKVLKETSTEDFDKYVQSAKEAKEDIKKPTPLAIAGDKAQETVNLIKDAKSKAGARKSQILETVKDKTVDVQPIMNDFDELLSSRFNLKVNPETLDIETIPGKVATISDAEIKNLQGLSDELLEISTLDSVPLGNLDALVDRLQDSLNFSKLERGVGGQATKTEKQISSFLEGSINKRLKEVAGDEFVNANNEFRRLLDLETKLTKALGKEGERGESLMKAVFSPLTGEKTKRIFRDIQEEFGVDLINEASLAKFAMQSVGDVRQANLLEALDLGPGFSGIQATKLAQVVDYLSKKAFSPERVGRGLTTAGSKGIVDSKSIDLGNTKQVDDLYQAYKKDYSDSKGVVIDSDDIKKMFSDFDPKKPELVHAPSSKLSQIFYEKSLAENPSKKVVLTAGGGGSGKSEVLIKNIKAGDPAIVFDGTGKSYDKMIKNYDLAIKAGKEPQIDAVYIDFNKAKQFNDARDRTVPLNLLEGTHSGYRKTLLRILKERPDIKVNLTENLGVKGSDGKALVKVIPKTELINFLERVQELEK